MGVAFTYVYVVDEVEYHVPRILAVQFEKAKNVKDRTNVASKVIDSNGVVLKDIDTEAKTS